MRMTALAATAATTAYHNDNGIVIQYHCECFKNSLIVIVFVDTTATAPAATTGDTYNTNLQ